MPQCDRLTEKRKSWRRFGAAASLAMLAAVPAAAQGARSPERTATLVLDVGSETENHLRYLQTLGDVHASQWMVRAFGPKEIDQLMAGDAAQKRGRLRSFEHPVHDAGWGQWQLTPVAGDAWYNSAFAFGENDAAVWRGRGATVAASAGVAARFGPVSLQLEPLVFWAENRAFPLLSPGTAAASPFADPLIPTQIDRPQRFGDGHYGRIDPGQSTVRIDGFGATAGFSTANEWWGPMSAWPYLLSNNAAGFPHAFFGSASPRNIGIGTLHGRIFYGRLEQTPYNVAAGSATSMFTTGIIASFHPHGIEGLEFGAARIFDITWPPDGLGSKQLRKPFEGFLKQHIHGDDGPAGDYDNGSADNQLASVFARWMLPASGFELYGELGRDDHSANGRDLTTEPDHQMTVGLGFRKAWRRRGGAISGFGAELFDFDPSILDRGRPQGVHYAHPAPDGGPQGHTNYGQVLGAGFAAIRGAGTRINWDHFQNDQGKTSLSLSRMVVREPLATLEPHPIDVQYVVEGTHTVRVNGAGVTYGLAYVQELNRYFAGSASNLQASLSLRW